MSCSYTGRLVRLVGLFLALGLATLLPASPASSETPAATMDSVVSDSAATPVASFMPPRPPRNTDEAPDSLAFDDTTVTDDWQRKALFFAAATATAVAAGLWLARTDLDVPLAKGYVGPAREAPFKAERRRDEVDPPRGNMIL